MSTLKVNTIQDTTGNDALTIDSSGNVTASQDLTLSGGFTPSTQLSHRNLIINGDMLIAQRGTSGTNTGDSQFPSVDRWLTRTYNGSGRVTLARQAISSNGHRYSLRATPSTTDTSGTYGYGLGQYIEGYNTSHLNWGTSSAKTITLSFWVKSSETGTFSVSFRNGAGNRSWVSSYTISTADTFEYKTITVTGPTDGGWEVTTNASILVEFCYGGQTAKSTSSLDQWLTSNYTAATGQTDIMGSTSNYFEITGVQLEAGSTATPFEHRSYAEELERCRRYYQKYGDVGQPYYHLASGLCNATTQATMPFLFMSEMRTAPTGSESGTWHMLQSATYNSLTSLNIQRTTTQGCRLEPAGSSFTTGSAAVVRANNDSGAYIAFDAELS